MASTASGLGASQAGAPGGPPGRELPGRRAIRTFLDKMKVEFAVIGVVIVYMVLVFADLMLNEEDGIPWWNPVFQVVDLGFLIAFTLELLVRHLDFTLNQGFSRQSMCEPPRRWAAL